MVKLYMVVVHNANNGVVIEVSMSFTLRRKLMNTSGNPFICMKTLIKSPHGIKV